MKTDFKKIIICFFMIMIFSVSSFGAEQKEVTIFVGEKISLDSFLIENEGLIVNPSAEWTSSNKDVITVDNSGVISGIRGGKAYVYVSIDKGNDTVSAVIKVNVVSMVKKFNILNKNAVVSIGDTYEIPYEITPIDGESKVLNDGIKWISSGKTVATVDEGGIVEGLKTGIITVTGYTEDGNYYDSIKIEVVKLSNKILIDDGKEKIKLKVGETHKFTAKEGSNDITDSLQWESRNPALLRVDSNGFVEALGTGSLMVKASTKDINNYDYIYVEIESMIKSLKFEKISYEINGIDDSKELKYTITPAIKGEDPIVKDIVWTYSDSSILRIDSDGIIIPLKSGVVKVTGTTKDGGFEDHCSIKVKIDDEENRDVFVQSFTVENFPETAMTGEKILLDIKYYPRHATLTKFSYLVDKGGNSQIQKIDEEMYFIPTVDGKNKITIRSESDVEQILTIDVKSPVRGVKILTNGFTQKSSKYLFYVGQEVDFEYEFQLKNGYTYSDIYLDDVKWTTSDSDIISLKTSENLGLLGTFKINGVGSSDVIVKSVDGNYSDKIRVVAESPINKVELKDGMVFLTNSEEKIETLNSFKSNLKSGIDEEDFVSKYEYTIDRNYLKNEYVQREIVFENEFIKELQKSTLVNPNLSSAIYKEIKDHRDRLKILENILKTGKDGYCYLPDNSNLKNRMGETLSLAKIDKNFITGSEEGKVDVSVEVPGTKFKDSTSIVFKNSDKSVLVVDDSGKLISYSNDINSGNKEIISDEEALKNEIALAMKINDRYRSYSASDIPETEKINGILFAEEKDVVPDSMKKNYKKNITREQICEISNKLYEYLSEEKIKTLSESAFLDTNNIEVTKAYNMGFVNSEERDKFLPKDDGKKVDIIESITGAIRVAKLSSETYSERLARDIDKIVREIMAKETEGMIVEDVVWYFSRIIK